MVTKERKKGPEGSTGEQARWWKITLETLIDTMEDDKNAWLQSSLGAKKKLNKNNKNRQQMIN